LKNADQNAPTAALKRLTKANRMIEGRAELESANRKIAKAQAIIDECAAVLRDTWGRRTD
jgi:flagellin-specific chaperone FliS